MVDVVVAHPADVARLVSHRFALAEVADAFVQAHDRPESTRKVLVVV